MLFCESRKLFCIRKRSAGLYFRLPENNKVRWWPLYTTLYGQHGGGHASQPVKRGQFLYPGTTYNPQGKLRLVYECNPFAFILSEAGGETTDGSTKILELEPHSLHIRTPFFAGSKFMMKPFTRSK